VFDIGSAPVHAACPRCGFENDFTLAQVDRRDVVICRGCKGGIRLDDHLNSVRAARRSIAAAVSELEDTLRGIGTITIRM